MIEASHPIDVSELNELLAGAREFMRVWSKRGAGTTCLVDASVIGPDPFGFRMALVDCVRHGANAYGQALGISAEKALARIREGIDAERDRPTDGAQQVFPKKDVN